MNQGKLEVVKQEMAGVNIDILGISELKWTGMGEFNSDNNYIYYCGQESLRRNEVTIIVNKSPKWSTWMQSQKQHPVVHVTGDGSKIRCYKQQYCIGTWNVRCMNQGKLEVVKQEMARMNTGLLGFHRTIQLQLLHHYCLGHRLGLLWYWMVCLGNEQKSFCRFWNCILLLHFGLLLTMMATPFLLRDSCPQ